MDHRDELEVLVELARAGNMRRAAAALSISQSTLSDAVTRLETAYGAALFERDRRGSHPTVYGQVVVTAATRALSIMDEAQREIGLIKGSASGRLVIGAEPGLIEPFLVPAIARGLRRYPKIRFRLHAVDSTTLVHEVREKRIDFFFGISPDGSTTGLSLRELGIAHVVPFVRPDHPLAGYGPHSLREIMAYPIVHGPAPRWLVRRIAGELGAGASAGQTALGDAAVIVNDFGAVRAVVKQTEAVGLAVAPLLESEFAAGVFSELQLSAAQAALLQLPLLIGTLDDRALPPAALTLIAEIESVVEHVVGGGTGALTV
jgi:DNA-binding transcriptional LysR family regulator